MHAVAPSVTQVLVAHGWPLLPSSIEIEHLLLSPMTEIEHLHLPLRSVEIEALPLLTSLRSVEIEALPLLTSLSSVEIEQLLPP